jgi:hypothetical protein
LLTTTNKQPIIAPMVESQINPAFLPAIAELDRQIEEAQRLKAALVARGSGLGGDALGPSGPAGAAIVPGDPLAAVREQEFSGLSPTKAARAFLLKIGRHEKTPVIIAALEKGGVTIGGKTPMPSLYTALSRHSAFVPLGKNYWDLAERRPDLVRTKGEKTEKKKARRKPRPMPRTANPRQSDQKPTKRQAAKKDGEKAPESGG